MFVPELGTDLRRASASAAAAAAGAAGTPLSSSKQAGGLQPPAALQDAAAADAASRFAGAAEQLALFSTQRCVQMTPVDWAELSAVLQGITRLCTQRGQPPPASVSTAGADAAALAHMLELLQRLGRVTACLLCVNADDRTFSIARVAQAIRTVTTLLEAVLQQAVPAGLSAEVADRLARQRCEQTPLLAAMAWAMGQEARALFFNPRPTALSLAAALMELFRVVQHLWPQGVFVAQHGQQFDAAAARMAEPAAQLALAMLRCAGCALQEVGTGAARQPLLCGLQVAWDLCGQLSALLQTQEQAAPACDQVKQLQASPAMPRLMLTLLAVETHRLHQQLGVTPNDSCIRLQAKREGQQRQGRSTRQSQHDAGQEQQPAVPLQHTPSQQQLQQQLQQQREQEEHEEIEGAGELHQLWHQVLGMAQKGRTREDQQQEEEEARVQRVPLQQLWLSLGLPEGLLQLAADADVPAAAAPAAAPAAATQDRYVAVCQLVLFLLQGSPLLQPHHHHHQHQHHGDAAQQRTLTVVTAVEPGSPAGWGSGAGRSAGPFAELARHAPAAAAGSPPLGSPGAAAWNLASTASLSPRELLQLQPDSATSLTAEAAEQLLEGARDHGLSGAEELELLRLQRVVPVVLLDTAGCLLRPGQAAGSAGGSNSSSVAALPPPSEQQLCVMHAACMAAACVSRCWPVLCKVTAQQDEAELLTACQPVVAGFGGLSTVCWQRYQTPAEVHLPVLELLQLVVRLLWQLQPPWQQQQQQQQRQADGQQQPPSHLLGDVWQPRAHGAAGQAPPANSSSSPPNVIVTPRAGECLDSLLEVLTAVSKLPRDPEHCNTGSRWGLGALASGAAAAAGDDDDSSSSSSRGLQSVQEGEARQVFEAWVDMCQPVAAAVEVCVRTAGQVAAAGVPKHVVQRHPSAVALGGCLASLCAPLGHPGPLVAAAAAAAPGGPAQQQLHALLTSEVKVLLWDPTSKKAGLIAMHALEQTPIALVKQLRGAATTAGLAAAAGAAERPWLLLLCRMMVLRGKLLGHLLGDGSSNGGDSREGASTLHTAFWHVRSAEQSAATLVACLSGSSSTDAAAAGHEAELRLQLLPALKQGVHMLKAALKLSRHCHEAGFASGFAAGFSSGYAAAMAAAGGAGGGSSVAADGSQATVPGPGPVAFTTPWGVLQQACITSLPAQLEAVGCGLAWHLRGAGCCCSNPVCVDLSGGSELWLLRDDAGDNAVLCGSCRRLGQSP